jgi:4-hydroxybenzoate polyprenyltransferase
LRVLIYLIRNVVYSNLFVSFCITLLAHQTYLLLKLPETKSFFVLAFIFCSTFFTYNFQRIYRLNSFELVGKLIGIRMSWIIRNRKKLFFASILSACGSLFFLFQLSYKVFLLILPLAIFSILYVIPFIKSSDKKIAIRDLPFAKIFIISLVWSLVMVAIPVVDAGGVNRLLESKSIFLLSEQFLFILAITLPFDIRDLRYDMESNIKTIPTYLGIKKTIMLSHLILLIFLSLKAVQYYVFSQLNFEQFLATAITIGVVMVIIAFTKRRRPELFFSGLIDGSMLLMYFGMLYLEY